MQKINYGSFFANENDFFQNNKSNSSLSYLAKKHESLLAGPGDPAVVERLRGHVREVDALAEHVAGLKLEMYFSWIKSSFTFFKHVYYF